MSFVLLIVRRIAAAVVILAALSVLIFAATEVLPGDTAGILAGAGSGQADRDALRQQLGLDAGMAERYRTWVTAAARGDLGTGYVGHREVAAVLGERLPNSLVLAALAMALAVPVAVALGLAAGLRGGRRTDRVISVAMLVTAGIPEFLIAVLLVAVFAAGFELLPAVSLVSLGARPWQAPAVLVLPAAALAMTTLAVAARMLRSSVADIATTPYIEAARLRGVSGLRLAMRHVLPNALGPAVQVVTVMFAGSVGGAVVVEALFNYPGVGFELQQAVANRDMPMVQGLALALSATTLAVLLVGDIVHVVLNPVLRGRS